MDLMTKNGSKILVETGVARHGLNKSKSDGASTIIFGLYAKNNGAKLYSVDINSAHITECQKTINKMKCIKYLKRVENCN